MLPCAHAEAHHHEVSDPIEVCAADHTVCHECSEFSCVKSTQVLPVSGSPVLEIPVRLILLITIFATECPPCVVTVRPSGTLQRLQTVQLLI